MNEGQAISAHDVDVRQQAVANLSVLAAHMQSDPGNMSYVADAARLINTIAERTPGGMVDLLARLTLSPSVYEEDLVALQG